jgi:2-polyprenyl-6-hydroxyphenyl methylase / 3-demethylubiquinone-9 3-methyltransferase
MLLKLHGAKKYFHHEKIRSMINIPVEIYERINNKIYDTQGDIWWQTDSVYHLIRVFFNPVRVSYSKKIVSKFFTDNISKRTALEVGCGGGILCEEIARMGFKTFGIDPSGQSVKTAIDHASQSGLKINYLVASGEALPFSDQTFDVVFCCDVLEHVRDLPKVISEIGRVLKPEGIFLYDTFNRTFLSKLVAIKVLQEWKRWAIIPSHLHEWKMFIKPEEIKLLLHQNNLIWKEHRGIKTDTPVYKILHYLRKRAKGYLTYDELGKKFLMIEGKKTVVMYMGYAVKEK